MPRSSDESSSDSSIVEDRFSEQRAQLLDEIEEWKKSGPFLFDTVMKLVRRCKTLHVYLGDDLSDVAHKFEDLDEWGKINQAQLYNNDQDTRAWTKATNNWQYQGNLQALSDDQLKVLSRKSAWYLPLRYVTNLDRLALLRLAQKLNRMHQAPWPPAEKRDASPTRSKPSGRKKATPKSRRTIKH